MNSKPVWPVKSWERTTFFKTLHCYLEKKEKIQSYNWAGIHNFEELWLMIICTLHIREGWDPNTEGRLYIYFSCPALKYKFYFIIGLRSFPNERLQKAILQLTPKPGLCTYKTYKNLFVWGNYTKGDLNLKWFCVQIVKAW